jgi:hypothetical protein
MQGLADGYFVLPYTIGNYLSGLLGSSPTVHVLRSLIVVSAPVFFVFEVGG